MVKNYTLQPRAQGRLRLDSLSLRIEGKVFKTKSFFINVTKAAQNNKQPRATRRNPYFPGGSPLFNQVEEADVRFYLDVSHKEAYVGEMIRADWLVLSDLGQVRYNVHKTPSLQGFWKENLLVDREPKFLGVVSKNQKTYRKTLFDSYMLFPIESGRLKIEPYSLAFQSFFSLLSGQKIRSSKSHTIHVKPLPKPEPASFTGAVGRFSVKASVKTQAVSRDQAISYKIRIEGQGQARTISLPKLEFPKDFHMYPPSEQSRFSPKKSWKEFEIILVPQKEGRLTIPSFKLATFDPRQAKYVEHITKAFSIEVSKSQGEFDSSLKFFNPTSKKQDFSMLLDKEFFIKEKTLLQALIAVYSVLSLLMLFLLVYTLVKPRSSFKKILNKRLLETERLLREKEQEKVLVSLINLIDFTLASCSSSKTEILSPSLYDEFFQVLSPLKARIETWIFSKDSARKPSLDQVSSLFFEVEAILRRMASKKTKTF